MEESILNSTKKKLGLAKEYTIFDDDIIGYINSAFSTLNQLGVGPLEGFMIEDAGTEWEEFNVPLNQMGMVRTYVALKAGLFFDPPQTSYLIAAKEKQIEEMEWRLNCFREVALDPTDPMTIVEEEVVYEY